jgi:hypothetical protein
MVWQKIFIAYFSGTDHVSIGITILLFFKCMRGLLWPKKRYGSSRNPYTAVYTFVLFSVTTVFVALNARNAQLAYIDFRGFPDGPFMYTLSQYGTVIVVTPNVAFVVANWLADGLLVCYFSTILTLLN